MDNSTHLKLGNAPMRGLIISMSLPTIFSMLVIAMYNIVDSIFVARIGEDALTALALVFPLQTLLIAVSTGTGIGASSYIARLLGSGETDRARNVATHAVILGILSWLLFAIFAVFGTEWYINAQTDNPIVRQMAYDYAFTVVAFSFGNIVMIVIEKLLQSSGHMMLTMYMQLIGAIINIILDPIFIFGYFGMPEFGVFGAALATVIGQICGLVLGIYFIIVKPVASKPKLKGFKFSFSDVFEIYRVGFPAMVMQSVSAFITVVLNGILMSFSQTAVAVLGIYFKLQTFVFMPLFGLTQGLMPIFAYNYGAKNKERLLSALKNGLFFGLTIMTLGAIVLAAFPRELLSIFSATEEMYEVGVPAMRIVSLAFIPAAVGITMSTFYQALGYGLYSLTSSMVRQIVALLPFAYFGSKIWGMNAVWFAYPFAEIFSSVVIAIIMIKVYNSDVKHLKPLDSTKS